MFIKLHYRDVEALIKLIEEDIGVEDLQPEESHAYTRLLLMKQSMLAARRAELVTTSNGSKEKYDNN